MRASAGGSLPTGKGAGCGDGAGEREPGCVGAVEKGRGEGGGCGRCCNAVDGRMGVVELH